MKVIIAAKSQEEFDSKRSEMIKALGGSKLDLILKAKGQNVFNTPTVPFFEAQRELLESWDSEFRKLLRDIKSDIEEIIG